MQKDEAIKILALHLMQCGMMMPVEWVQNNGEDSKFMQAYQMAMDALKNEPVPCKEWISVNDRLPDTAERVLVCKTWNGRVYKPEYGYYQDYPNSKGCWYVLTEYGYYPQREVTHWMPLPQPPKGE